MSENTRLDKSLMPRTREFALSCVRGLFTQQALAKINLRLKVVGRREDGYHLLSMFNCNTDLSDQIELTLSESPQVILQIEPHGILNEPPASNLAVRAFHAFWQAFDLECAPVGVTITIRKRIPIGSGLGGGSSDAAAVLRILADNFQTFLCVELGLSEESFRESIVKTALSCGADVPYSLYGGACWVRGIGERVLPLVGVTQWPGEVLIVVPPTPVPTRAFYNYYRERHPIIPSASDVAMESFSRHPVKELRELIENDFERDVVAFVPEVGETLKVVRRLFPEGSSITGSGCAIFALAERGELGRIEELVKELTPRGVSVHRASMIETQLVA